MAMVWSQRSGVYLFGVLCLVLSSLAFAVGLVAPFWQLRNGDPALNVSLLHTGLWFHCGDDLSCFTPDYSSDPDYLHVTRGLQLGGLLALAVCVMMTCIANCRRQHPRPRVDVVITVFVLITALQSLSGPLVYLVFSVEDVNTLPHLRYDWAFAVSLGASGLALLSFVLLLLSITCCSRGCTCRSSFNTKTDDARGNWWEDSYTESREATLRPEDWHGPYTVSSDHYIDHAELAYFRHRRGLPPSEQHFPPEESEYLYGVGSEGLCCGYPFSGRGEVVSMRHDRPRGVRTVEDQGGHLASGWSWHAGVDMTLGKSPPWRGRGDENWLYYDNTVRSSRLSEPIDPMSESRILVHGASPFLFPRVVVRGFYVPGYGYPEYIMNRGNGYGSDE